MRLENYITEGGQSGPERYNTELACLLAYTMKKPSLSGFDPTDPVFEPRDWWDDKRLQDPDHVYTEIMHFLPKYYNAKVFKTYYDISVANKKHITRKVGPIPKLFWIGGSNATGSDSNPADVEFFGSDAFGISVKGKQGITLSNLSPSYLGVDSPRGVDSIKYYCDKSSAGLYDKWKTAVIKSTLAKAKSMKGEVYTPAPKSPHYSIRWNKDGSYTLVAKNKSQDFKVGALMAEVGHNTVLHSVFGAHLTANTSEFAALSKQVFEATAQGVLPLITEALVNSSVIEKLLNFSVKPYFYQSQKSLYYVPSRSELTSDPLEVKGISYTITDKKATGFVLKVKIGRKGSKEFATMDLWLRYANRVFGANATVRLQELKNPQSIAWEKLA
jgi:hypothetical protein